MLVFNSVILNEFSVNFLDAGSAAFSGSNELCDAFGGEGSPLHIFILCDWKSAWSLLYNPIEEGEREKIREELKVC